MNINYTTTDRLTAREIDAPAILDTAYVGDRVRSFDWKGSADCMEGIVTKVEDLGSGCFKYTIEVDTIWESEACSETGFGNGGDATVIPYENTNRTITRVVQPEGWSKRQADFVNLRRHRTVTINLTPRELDMLTDCVEWAMRNDSNKRRAFHVSDRSECIAAAEAFLKADSDLIVSACPPRTA